MTKSSKIVLSVLGAAAVGVIIGGLFYTDKGAEIRGQISDKACDAKDKLADLYSKGKDRFASKANGLKKQAEDAIA